MPDNDVTAVSYGPISIAGMLDSSVILAPTTSLINALYVRNNFPGDPYDSLIAFVADASGFGSVGGHEVTYIMMQAIFPALAFADESLPLTLVSDFFEWALEVRFTRDTEVFHTTGRLTRLGDARLTSSIPEPGATLVFGLGVLMISLARTARRDRRTPHAA